MAEENKNTQQEPDANEQKNKEPEKKTPTIEELTLQLAQANAERAKYKNSIDKLTHDNAELTKWKRERMSAQEQQDEAEAQAKAQMDAYVKELEEFKLITEASSRYIGMGMDVELAKATATAEIKGDMDTVLANINKNKEDALKAAKAEWLKSRPDIPDGGTHSGLTVEQFREMNLFEKTKLRREDLETYNRLLAQE